MERDRDCLPKKAGSVPAALQGFVGYAPRISRNGVGRQRSVPDFDNTIAALDRSGALLRRVSLVFGGQNSCNTTPELQALSKELSPLLSAHSDDISLNAGLFARVKQVYNNRERMGLNKEQTKLLEETYKDFVRSGM